MTAKLLLYLGTMLLIGGVAARQIVTPVHPRVRQLLLGLLLLSMGACWSVYGVLAQLEMLNITDTLDYLTRVQAGRAVLIMLIGACLLLAAHLSRFSRLTEIGAAGLALWGLAGIGHGATHGDWVRFLHTLHAGAMSVWLGGVLALFTFPGKASKEAARSSRVALACVLTLALTGSVMALNHAGRLLALPETDYGRTLLLKVAVFAVTLLTALVVRAALHRNQSARAALLVEVLLLVLVLILTSSLSQLPPPSHQLETSLQMEQKIHV